MPTRRTPLHCPNLTANHPPHVWGTGDGWTCHGGRVAADDTGPMPATLPAAVSEVLERVARSEVVEGRHGDIFYVLPRQRREP